MGEYADMIINGDTCQLCGEWLGEGDGYARFCRSCSHEERKNKKDQKSSKKKNEGKKK